MLYEGPDFRSFNFQFALFTKSEKDAKNIKSIVDALRKASLPSAGGAQGDNENLQGVFANSAGFIAVEGAAQSIIGSVQGLLDPDKTAVGGLNKGLGNFFTAGGVGAAAAAAGGGLLFGGVNRFIKQPPFVLMTYKRGADVHPFIQPLLPAAINQLSFDFTTSGNYTQLANFDKTDEATTIGVNITMQVTEVTNLFSDTLFTKRAPGV